MPRKSKDESKAINKTLNKDILESEKAKSNTRKVNSKKVKEESKKDPSTNIEKNKSVKKDTVTKNKSTRKTPSSKTSNVKSSKQSSVNTSKNKSGKKVSKNKEKVVSKNKKVFSTVEYYDLPYRYNETTVKILAQTPTMLFIYWDISDSDRASFVEKYGDDFFNSTKPVLIVTNRTMNYSFEIEINDFANSWYLHVNDADCDYSVELGRRPIYSNSNIDNYIYVSTSNDMEMPNNHILFDRLGKSVFFKNVKNNFIEEKQISSISFIRNLGQVYDIYELYKELYKDEIDVEELNNNIKLNLSSSNSSTFK